jgi:hypothetical protein
MIIEPRQLHLKLESECAADDAYLEQIKRDLRSLGTNFAVDECRENGGGVLYIKYKSSSKKGPPITDSD